MTAQPKHGEAQMYLLALPVAERVHTSGAGTFALIRGVQNYLLARGGRVVQSSLEPPGVLVSFGEAVYALQAALAISDVPRGPQQGDGAYGCMVMLDANDLTGGTRMWADMVNHLRSLAQPGTVFISVGALTLLQNLPDAVSLIPVKSSAALSEASSTQLFEMRTDRSEPRPTPADGVPFTGMIANISTFVGRETEVNQIRALLLNKRLITISGPGGSGKTRLALHITEEVRETFPDGVAIVDLSPISDPSLVAPALAAALELREEPGAPLQSTIIRHLKSRTALIVLDNCEHLIDACAQLSANILQSCSGIFILATSREPLGVYGETIWRLAPLPVPHPDRARQADDLLQFPATRLFIERAAAAHPNLQVPDAQVQAVVEICRQLDGMPLAIELAAAQVKFLSLQQLSDRLHDAFRLLVTRSRTAHARQQTLRLTMDWSYDLLTEEEQSLFRRLAVFSGGASLEAIEAVCAGENVESESILSLVAQLVDKSLVMVEDEQSETRYRLLEVVRQYCLMRLSEVQEEEEMRRRHFHWVHALAQQAHPHYDGPQQAHWLNRMEQEHDNVRAALAWCQTGPLLPDEKVNLLLMLVHFWYVRGLYSEGLAHCAAVMDESTDCSPRLRAEVLRRMGSLAASLGDHARAESLLEACREVLIGLDDQLPLFGLLFQMGALAEARGELDGAEQFFEQCLTIAQTTGDLHSMAFTAMAFARIAYYRHDYKQARTWIEDAVHRFGEIEDLFGLVHAKMVLGDTLRNLKDYNQAYRVYLDSLPYLIELGNPDSLASCLDGIAFVLEQCGSPALAVQLLGHCDFIRQKFGVPIYVHGLVVHESTVANLKKRLGETTFLRLWEQGKRFDLDQWLSRLQLPQPPRGDGTATSGERLVPDTEGERLTEREKEVAELVRKGHTDKEIGRILHISSRTVDGHLRSIFAKVNVSSRAALAAWAVEHRIGRS